MSKMLDRKPILSFLKAYLVGVTSLLCTYVVVDLYVNLDALVERHKNLANVVAAMVDSYCTPNAAFNVLAIAIVAAVFAFVWVQHNSEPTTEEFRPSNCRPRRESPKSRTKTHD